jgi:ubiquitin-protein ligase
MSIKTFFAKKEKRPSAGFTHKEERSKVLLREYDRVFKLFREHHSISIREVFGVPPKKYRVVYLVDGLVQKGKSIESKGEHVVEVSLPDNFPDDPPFATMPLPVYHPNISPEKIDVSELWKQSPTLADCIVGIGEMIVFQRYSTEQPLNGEAAQWALRNKSLLPLSSIDLHYREMEAAPGLAADSTAPSLDQPTEKIVYDAKTKVIVVGEDTARIQVERKQTAAAAQRQDAPAPEAAAQTAEAGSKTKMVPDEPGIVDIPIQGGAGSTIKVEHEKPVARTHREFEATKEAAVEKNNRVKEAKKSGRDVRPPAPERTSSVTDHREAPAEPPASRPDTPLKIDDRITAPLMPPTGGGGYCPNCGSKNDGNANFCARCGTRLTTKSSQRIAKLFFIISVIAIPIIIIEMGAISILLQKKGLEPKAVTELLQRITPPQQPEAQPASPAPIVNETPPVPVVKNERAEPSENPGASASPPSPKGKAGGSGVASVKMKQKAARKSEESDEDAAQLFSQSSPNSGSKQFSNASVADNLKLARLYMGIGSYDDAIKRYNDVLAADPSNKEALAGLEKARKMKFR